MSRLQNLRAVDPVLSNLAQGYSNAEFVGATLLPFVSVEKEGGKIPVFGKEHFRVYATERALRANSNRISPEDFGSRSIVLDEHDLEYPVDYREEAEAALRLETHATFRVSEGIRLRHEKMVADMVQDPTLYASGNKLALSGSDTFDKDSSDPEGVVDDAKAAVRAAIVREPNTLVLGYQTWRALKRHKSLKAVLSDTRSRLVQLADLREIFEIEHIVVGKGVCLDDKTGKTVDLWGKTMVFAYVPKGAPSAGVGAPVHSVYEPSFGYTPRKLGNPVIDKRSENGGKLTVVRCTDIFRPCVLGADAGYLVTGTVT